MCTTCATKKWSLLTNVFPAGNAEAEGYSRHLCVLQSLRHQQLRIEYDFKELYRHLLQKNLTLPNQVCIWHKTWFEVLQLIKCRGQESKSKKCCLLHQRRRKLRRGMTVPLAALCYLGGQGEITNPQQGSCWLPMGMSLSSRLGPHSFFTFLHILTPYVCFRDQKPSPARK